MTKKPHPKKAEVEDIKTFLHNVAWLRKQHGLSKKVIATLLNISVKDVKQIERGIIPPDMSVAVVFQIHKHFGVRPEDQFQWWLGD